MPDDVDKAIKWARDWLDGWKHFEARPLDPTEPSIIGKCDMFARAIVALADRDEDAEMVQLRGRVLRLENLLRWLDNGGGLGADVHAWIRAALGDAEGQASGD